MKTDDGRGSGSGGAHPKPGSRGFMIDDDVPLCPRVLYAGNRILVFAVAQGSSRVAHDDGAVHGDLVDDVRDDGEGDLQGNPNCGLTISATGVTGGITRGGTRPRFLSTALQRPPLTDGRPRTTT